MSQSDRGWHEQLRRASLVVLGGAAILALNEYAIAQVIPDNTLGVESSVIDAQTENITGGARRGDNLFHSFREFNIGEGNGIYFANPDGVRNIFSRVTGTNASNISGKLGVMGNANLFFMNPNGIIFGANASLDIRGSFLATTANSLIFDNGLEFSANSSETPPLLTINIPIGLQFGDTPASIVNRSRSPNLFPIPPIDPQFPTPSTVGLQVLPGRTLALIGGDIVLEGGQLTAFGGRIELGSVAGSGLVRLIFQETGLTLGYEGIPIFKDIRLSNGASVDASGIGSGDIQLTGRRVTLNQESRLVSFNLGMQQEIGGTININASESVELIGTGTYIQDFQKLATQIGVISDLRNGLFTVSSGSGTAGNIIINTRQFIARDGAFVVTSTAGSGQGGDLIIISDSVELMTSALLTGTSPKSTGNSGSLSIRTGRLTARDYGLVTTSSLGQGQAGTLTINASNSVELIGSNPIMLPNTVFIFTGLATTTLGNGNAGDLQVATGRLLIQDGAIIVANTFGEGKGANIRIIVENSVELRGESTNNQLGSGISAQTTSNGDAGNLNIETEQLSVRDGASVNVNSAGSGRAGNLEVIARSIQLDNQGAITATTRSGNGGNINFQVQDLLQLRGGSRISTTAGLAGAGGNGGNIQIDTKFIVATPNENSDITANAFEGRGGNITINTQGIFGIQYREDQTDLSDITVSSELGVAGIVNINNPEVDLNQGLVNLLVLPDRTEVVQACSPSGNNTSEFTVTGRGGLPPTPQETLNNEPMGVDWVTLPSGSSTVSKKPDLEPVPDRIIEAQGWIVEADGKVVLVAQADSSTHSWQKPVNCHGD